MNAVIACPSLNDASYPGRFGIRDERRDNEGLSLGDFESFVRDYMDHLRAVATRMLRCEVDAADAVQDALLSAFVAREKFQGDSTVYTWLYRIVVNTCLMKLRTHSRVKLISLDDNATSNNPRGCQADAIADESERAESRMERDELRVAVQLSMIRLPECYQTILRLRDLEGFSTDQTAARLNLSRSAVKTRLHRARRALRSLLEPAFV